MYKDVVLQSDWSTVRPVQFKVSLAPLDDMGFPFDRRGMVVNVPQDRRDYAAYADEVGKKVSNTILMLLGEELEEETNG